MKRKLHRKVSSDHFVRIPNQTVRESGLSPEAIGVLVYLLSHSETFDHWRTKLMNDFNIKMHKYQRIMKELETAGYILRTKGGADGGANLYVTDIKNGLSDVRKNRTSENHDVVKIKSHKNTKHFKNIKKPVSAKNADGKSRSIPWNPDELFNIAQALGIPTYGLTTVELRNKIKTSQQG